MRENRQSAVPVKGRDDFLAQGAILAGAMMLTKLIGVVYRIPLTRILGDEGNGFYGYAFEIYAMTLMLSSFSLPTAVSKLVSQRLALGKRKNAFRIFVCSLTFSVVIGAFITCLIFFGASFIASHIMRSPLSVYALRVLAVGLFIVSVMGVLRGYFQGLGTMTPTAISQIIEQLINAAVSLAGAYALYKVGEKKAVSAAEPLLGPAYGAAGATLGTVVGALFGFLFLIFTLALIRRQLRRMRRRDVHSREESYGRILKILILTIAPVIFSTAIYNINQILDLTIFNIILEKKGFAEFEYMALQGIYTGKYNTLINVPLAMANGLAAAVLPSLAYSMGNRRGIHQKLDTTIRMTMLISIPCFIGCSVLARPLMELLYHDSSSIPSGLLMTGSVTIVLYSWCTITNSILQGLDNLKAPVKNAFAALCIHLIALVVSLGVFDAGVHSLVISNIVFGVCMSYLNTHSINRTCRYVPRGGRNILAPLLMSAAMGIVVWLCYRFLYTMTQWNSVSTVVSILFGVCVYVVLILKTGVMSKRDIRALPGGDRLLHLAQNMGLV